MFIKSGEVIIDHVQTRSAGVKLDETYMVQLNTLYSCNILCPM